MATKLQPDQRREVFNCFKCGHETDGFTGTARYDANQCRACFGKREDRRPRDLNDLSGKQWAALSKSVDTFPDQRSAKQRRHGASFPQALATAHIEMYTKAGATVFDPFVGVGTTVDAAIQLGRVGIGIDINPDFIELARSAEGIANSPNRLICDDAMNMCSHIPHESVDFLFTSPPYGNLLRNVKGAFAYKWKEHSKITSIRNPAPYSGKLSDLGNMCYEDFLGSTEKIMRESVRVLRPRAYSAWVVKDFRDVKNGVPFVNFHGDIIDCGIRAGFQLWDIRVVDQTKFRPLVCLGFPSDNFYLNIGHSYVVIFRNA
jgi:DNA modification methylase